MVINLWHQKMQLRKSVQKSPETIRNCRKTERGVRSDFLGLYESYTPNSKHSSLRLKITRNNSSKSAF